ncbi:hypothetical protein [Sorangium sp. So ce233]|uniref:hypothetical protein n=1 Tax=Sorangium sp. So ce233 TaxID=3133290 RepID=UPI003F62C610
MPLQVTIEQAALNALATWLESKLPQGEDDYAVVVSPKWPDDDTGLPARAVTILLAGERRDTYIEPTVHAEERIHAAVSPRVGAPAATDLASAAALLNACKASYEAHRVDEGAHQAADEENAIEAPDADDLESAVALAQGLRTEVNGHRRYLRRGAAVVHEVADEQNVIAAFPATEAGVIAAAESIRRALDRHYAARVYVWRIRACEQPVQLDVWAEYDAHREDVMARLEPALNAAPGEAIGDPTDDTPVDNGVLLPLGDGWPGYVDFDFDRPRRITTPGSQKQGEFRATYMGKAEFWLLVKAQSARMARIAVRQRIDGTTVALSTTSSSASGDPAESFTTT